MESLNPKLALYGSYFVLASTNTVFFPLSEVNTRAVIEEEEENKLYFK